LAYPLVSLEATRLESWPFASRRIELTAAGDRAWVSKPTSYEDQEKIGQQRRETQPLVSGRHLSSDRASAPGGSCFLGGMSALMLSCESRSTVEDSGFPKGGPFYGSVCLWCRYKARVGHHLTAASRPPRRDWNQSPGRGSTKPRRALSLQNSDSSSGSRLYYAWLGIGVHITLPSDRPWTCVTGR